MSSLSRFAGWANAFILLACSGFSLLVDGKDSMNWFIFLQLALILGWQQITDYQLKRLESAVFEKETNECP